MAAVPFLHPHEFISSRSVECLVIRVSPSQIFGSAYLKLMCLLTLLCHVEIVRESCLRDIVMGQLSGGNYHGDIVWGMLSGRYFNGESFQGGILHGESFKGDIVMKKVVRGNYGGTIDLVRNGVHKQSVCTGLS